MNFSANELNCIRHLLIREFEVQEDRIDEIDKAVRRGKISEEKIDNAEQQRGVAQYKVDMCNAILDKVGREFETN